ncbi:MAG: chromosomal replication initiator protein DnaA [Lachnospiraceae bacterium]|nr:chromosomal replication initiator protein DnaA [Lachnospiraceae bacterium]
MKPVQEKWDIIKNAVITDYGISQIAVKLWIDPMEYFSETDDTVTIILPNDKANIIELLTEKYKDFFIIAIYETLNNEYDVKFIADEKKPQEESNNQKIVQEKESTNTSLIKKYTFDNFVTGNNSFAVSACLAVAETAGTDSNPYNPLYIYGGSGLGKTHLMHAIGNYLNEHNPSLKILYVTSENFTNEIVNSLRSDKKYNTDSMSELKEKYRNVDVLLIDDIQFVIGKEATQLEFFNTFNALYENGKSIIISSDKHPKYMETLDERYLSRFQMGLQVDVQPPNYETRKAILDQLNQKHGNKIDDDILIYITDNISSNIRELEGAYNKLIALSKISSDKITLEMAKNSLKDIINPNKTKVINFDVIIEEVSKHYNISINDIYSTKKNKEIATARQIVMYLCNKLTEDTKSNIGNKMGRDHATVIHNINKVTEKIENDPSFEKNIDSLIKTITSL